MKNRFQISDTTLPRNKEINTAIAIAGVHDFGDAKNVCPNLILFLPKNV